MFGKLEMVIYLKMSSNYLDTFCLLQDSKAITVLYNKLEHKSELKRLVGKVLDKKLAKAVHEITIKNLLEWDMWPLLLSIHSEFIRKLNIMFFCVCLILTFSSTISFQVPSAQYKGMCTSCIPMNCTSLK